MIYANFNRHHVSRRRFHPVCGENGPNHAMQRTASQPAIDILSVGHPRFGCVDSCTGLAVADLVSR
jgi:hypothetical protein